MKQQSFAGFYLFIKLFVDIGNNSIRFHGEFVVVILNIRSYSGFSGNPWESVYPLNAH